METTERSVIHGCTPGMEIPEKYLPSPAPEKTGETLLPPDTYQVCIREESRRLVLRERSGVVCKVVSYSPPILTLAVYEHEHLRGYWILGEPNQPVPERHMALGRFVDTDGIAYPTIDALLAEAAPDE